MWFCSVFAEVLRHLSEREEQLVRESAIRDREKQGQGKTSNDEDNEPDINDDNENGEFAQDVSLRPELCELLPPSLFGVTTMSKGKDDSSTLTEAKDVEKEANARNSVNSNNSGEDELKEMSRNLKNMIFSQQQKTQHNERKREERGKDRDERMEILSREMTVEGA